MNMSYTTASNAVHSTMFCDVAVPEHGDDDAIWCGFSPPQMLTLQVFLRDNSHGELFSSRTGAGSVGGNSGFLSFAQSLPSASNSSTSTDITDPLWKYIQKLEPQCDRCNTSAQFDSCDSSHDVKFNSLEQAILHLVYCISRCDVDWLIINDGLITKRVVPGGGGHPNVAPCLRVLEMREAYVLMYARPTGTLRDMLLFSPDILVQDKEKSHLALLQLLSAVRYCHSRRLCCGDLEPNLIGMDDDYVIQVMGWQPCLRPSQSYNDVASVIDVLLNGGVEPAPAPAMESRSIRASVSPSSSPLVSSPLNDGNGLFLRDLDSHLHQPRPKLYLHDYILEKPITEYMHAWLNGQLSNFDYLMYLNAAAGRTVSDPSYHPIFPWVLDFSKDFECSVTDILKRIESDDDNASNSMIWRDLSKSKYRLQRGDEQMDLTYGHAPVPHHIPEALSELTYHIYLARRSNIKTLQHSVRPVFVGNEYPASMSRMYDTSPDECIPEFYCDPVIFMSSKSMKSAGLSDVVLPAWASNPRVFVCVHRIALESEHVSRNLHRWIDLAFGHLLSGTESVAARNVPLNFQPPMALLRDDELLVRDARAIPKRRYGLVQLFASPHPVRPEEQSFASFQRFLNEFQIVLGGGSRRFHPDVLSSVVRTPPFVSTIRHDNVTVDSIARLLEKMHVHVHVPHDGTCDTIMTSTPTITDVIDKTTSRGIDERVMMELVRVLPGVRSPIVKSMTVKPTALYGSCAAIALGRNSSDAYLNDYLSFACAICETMCGFPLVCLESKGYIMPLESVTSRIPPGVVQLFNNAIRLTDDDWTFDVWLKCTVRQGIPTPYNPFSSRLYHAWQLLMSIHDSKSDPRLLKNVLEAIHTAQPVTRPLLCQAALNVLSARLLAPVVRRDPDDISMSDTALYACCLPIMIQTGGHAFRSEIVALYRASVEKHENDPDTLVWLVAPMTVSTMYYMCANGGFNSFICDVIPTLLLCLRCSSNEVVGFGAASSLLWVSARLNVTLLLSSIVFPCLKSLDRNRITYICRLLGMISLHLNEVFIQDNVYSLLISTIRECLQEIRDIASTSSLEEHQRVRDCCDLFDLLSVLTRRRLVKQHVLRDTLCNDATSCLMQAVDAVTTVLSDVILQECFLAPYSAYCARFYALYTTPVAPGRESNRLSSTAFSDRVMHTLCFAMEKKLKIEVLGSAIPCFTAIRAISRQFNVKLSLHTVVPPDTPGSAHALLHCLLRAAREWAESPPLASWCTRCGANEGNHVIWSSDLSYGDGFMVLSNSSAATPSDNDGDIVEYVNVLEQKWYMLVNENPIDPLPSPTAGKRSRSFVSALDDVVLRQVRLNVDSITSDSRLLSVFGDALDARPGLYTDDPLVTMKSNLREPYRSQAVRPYDRHAVVKFTYKSLLYNVLGSSRDKIRGPDTPPLRAAISMSSDIPRSGAYSLQEEAPVYSRYDAFRGVILQINRIPSIDDVDASPLSTPSMLTESKKTLSKDVFNDDLAAFGPIGGSKTMKPMRKQTAAPAMTDEPLPIKSTVKLVSSPIEDSWATLYGSSNTIHIWTIGRKTPVGALAFPDRTDDARLRTPARNRFVIDPSDYPRGISYINRGSCIIGTNAGGATLWDCRTCNNIHSWRCNSGYVTPWGEHESAMVSEDGSVTMIDTRCKSVVSTLSGVPLSMATCAASSLDSHLLAIGSDEGRVSLMDLRTGCALSTVSPVSTGMISDTKRMARVRSTPTVSWMEMQPGGQLYVGYRDRGVVAWLDCSNASSVQRVSMVKTWPDSAMSGSVNDNVLFVITPAGLHCVPWDIKQELIKCSNVGYAIPRESPSAITLLRTSGIAIVCTEDKTCHVVV